MKWRISCLVLLVGMFLSQAPRAQMTANLPQIANGNLIQTTFVFFNNGDDTATVTLTLTDDNGDPFPISIGGLGDDSVHVFTLEPGETRFFKTDGQGENRAGAARVFSTSEIGVSAIFSLINLGTILTEAGIGASPSMTDFVIAVDTTRGFNTGVAIQNLGGADNEVTFTLVAPDEPPAGAGPQAVLDQTTRTIPGNGQLAVYVSGSGQLFPSLPETQARMIVSAESEVAALTLRQRGLAPLTTLPAVAIDSTRTSFVLPQVADGGGVIKTQFVMFGLDTGTEPSAVQSGTVNLNLTDDNGDPLEVSLSTGESGSSFSLPITSDGALFFETDGTRADPVAGAATVTSDIPIGVSSIFTLDLPGRETVEAGVGDSPGLQNFTLPADLTAPFNTGLAVLNNNAETAEVTMNFINQDGNLILAEKVQISPFSVGEIIEAAVLEPLPGSHHRDGYLGMGEEFLSDLDLAGRQGQVAVESSVPLNALTLRQSPTTLTTLPVEPGVADVGDPTPGPTGTELIPTTVSGLDLTAARTLDQVLDVGWRIDGTITRPQNFFSGSVAAIRQADGETFDGSTEIFGGYAVNVPDGVYDLLVCSTGVASLTGPPTSLLFVGTLQEDISVSNHVTQDILVTAAGTVPVTGSVTNLQILPPLPAGAGAFIVFDIPDQLVGSLAQVAADGSYTADLSPGTYRVSVGFLSGPDNDMDGFPEVVEQAGVFFDIDELTVAGSSLSGVDFTIPAVATLSGLVSQPQTPVIPEGSAVLAFDRDFPVDSLIRRCFPTIGFSQASVAPDGSYQTTLLTNRTYDISAGLPAVGVGTEDEGIWSTPVPGTSSVPISGNLSQDFVFPSLPPEVTLMGNVTDPNGVPQSGISVLVTALGGITGAANTSFVIRTDTAADGSYAVQVLSGSGYTVRFDPGPPNLTPGPGPFDRKE